jgi:hypothetical protein
VKRIRETSPHLIPTGFLAPDPGAFGKGLSKLVTGITGLFPKSNAGRREEIFMNVLYLYTVIQKLSLPESEFIRQVSVRFGLAPENMQRVAICTVLYDFVRVGPMAVHEIWSNEGLLEYPNRKPSFEEMVNEVVTFGRIFFEMNERWDLEAGRALAAIEKGFDREQWLKLFDEF